MLRGIDHLVIAVPDLAAAISIDSPNAQTMLQGFSQMMTAPGVLDPAAAGRKAFAGYLHLKALTMAFGDAFFWLAAGCAVAAVLGLLGKPAKMTINQPSEAH